MLAEISSIQYEGEWGATYESALEAIKGNRHDVQARFRALAQREALSACHKLAVY